MCYTWASLHGVVMLAEQGLLTGQAAQVSQEELVEDIVAGTKLALSIAIEANSKVRHKLSQRRKFFSSPRLGAKD